MDNLDTANDTKIAFTHAEAWRHGFVGAFACPLHIAAKSQENTDVKVVRDQTNSNKTSKPHHSYHQLWWDFCYVKAEKQDKGLRIKTIYGRIFE